MKKRKCKGIVFNFNDRVHKTQLHIHACLQSGCPPIIRGNDRAFLGLLHMRQTPLSPFYLWRRLQRVLENSAALFKTCVIVSAETFPFLSWRSAVFRKGSLAFIDWALVKGRHGRLWVFLRFVRSCLPRRYIYAYWEMFVHGFAETVNGFLIGCRFFSCFYSSAWCIGSSIFL